MRRLILMILAACFLSGCYGTHFHNRSVVHYVTQNAATYGTITNTPAESGTQSVEAAKTTDLDAAVNTSSGNAENGKEDEDAPVSKSPVVDAEEGGSSGAEGADGGVKDEN